MLRSKICQVIVVDSRNTADVWRNVCEFAEELKVAHKERQQVYHQLFQPGYQPQHPPRGPCTPRCRGTLTCRYLPVLHESTPLIILKVRAFTGQQFSVLHSRPWSEYLVVQLNCWRRAMHHTAPHQANSSDGNKAVRKGAGSVCYQIKNRKLLEKSRKAQTHSQKIQPD